MIARMVIGIGLLLSLSVHSFAQSVDAAREFLNGHRNTFSVKGHPKANGVNFTIAYPSSWAAAEGERPGIVQKFFSEGGRGFESAIIIIKELPLPPGTVVTKAELSELFAPSELRKVLPAGATLVEARPTEIEALPAEIIEYTTRAERAGMAFLMHVWALNIVSGNNLIQIQFQVGGVAGSEGDISRRMTEFKPLFVLMANSIIFPDKWTAIPEVPTNNLISSSLPYDNPSMLIPTLIVNIIITWGIGLTPPLLIRYIVMRRPLSKKAASWIAAGFSAFFWVSFLAITNAIGEKPSTGTVWIIMFIVARWIMCRGYIPASPVERVSIQQENDYQIATTDGDKLHR